jgi:hypothetical protein
LAKVTQQPFLEPYSRMNLFSSNASYLWDTSETKYVILKTKIMLILRLSLSILTFSNSRKTKHYIEIYSIFLRLALYEQCSQAVSGVKRLGHCIVFS